MTATAIEKRRRYSGYRPSCVEWLGEIPAEWQEKRLRFCVRINPTKAETRSLNGSTLVSFVPMEAVGEYGGLRLDQTKPIDEVATGYTFFQDGDVVIAKITPCFENGKGAIAEGLENGIGFGTTELHVLRPSVRLERRYLFYLTISHAFRNFGAAYMYGAGGQKRIPDDFIRDFRHPIPTLEEQRAIAAFLDRETARIDALLSKKERQIELLQEKRTALISHVVTKGLNPDVKMKSSGIEWLGEIPEHWKIVPLKFAILPRGDAIKTGPFGSQLLSSEMVAGSVKVYNQRNVLDRDFLSGENYITEDKYQELIAFTIFPGDILVTTRGTIGRCALFPANAQPGILHPCLMRIQANPQVVLPDYLPMLIQDGGIVLLQLKLMSNATTIDVIYSESLKSVRLPLPSTQEQQKILTWINREVTKHDKLVATVCESIEKLREYRTALISAAVTGQIDVSKRVSL